MAGAKQYGVYQRDGQLVAGTMRASRKAARRDFAKACDSPRWHDLWLLGFCVRRVGAEPNNNDWEACQRSAERAQARPPKGPGLLLPRQEHQQQPQDLVNLQEAQFEGDRQLDHGKDLDLAGGATRQMKALGGVFISRLLRGASRPG